MLFMIIETFKDSDMIPVYQRLREGGRSDGNEDGETRRTKE